MISSLELFFATIILFLSAWILYRDNKQRGKHKWLPGPPRLPFVGSVPFLIPYQLKYPKDEATQQMGKQYGKVWGAQIGVHYCVLISDLETAKKIMTSDEWANRYNDHPVFYERSFNKQIGIGFANGENWRQMRKYTIRILRQFGFGKNQTMEQSLQVELDQLINKISSVVDQNNGQGIIDAHLFFYVPLLNVLWTMMAGDRFPHDHKELRELLTLGERVCKMAQQGTTPMFAFPILRKIPYLTEQDLVLKFHRHMQNLFRGIMNERREKGTYKDDPQDFMDVFLKDIDESKSTPREEFFTDEQFIMVCSDLFFGTNSVSAAMEFSIMYMILHPRVQRKVQKEIDKVVGYERLPSLEDRTLLPYTEATIQEVMRVANILPLTGRCPKEDNEINGCFVPKGTIVGIDLKSIHLSTDYWDDPHEFRPERFLDETETKLINSEKILLFGIGTRFCIADVVAKSSIFLFFVSLLQKYSFEKSTRHSAPSPIPLSGFSQNPVPFHTLVTKRHV